MIKLSPAVTNDELAQRYFEKRVRFAKHCPANYFSGLRNKALGTARLTERFCPIAERVWQDV
jgi:hypothetical protein